MGVNLSGILEPEELEVKDLASRALAVDAHNTIYQFLSIIRQPDGTPLMDRQGNVTSHLSGLLYRNANLIEHGIRPCYVFDGEVHDLKLDTVQQRRERREAAMKEWEAALEEGDMERAYSKATQSTRMTKEVLDSSRELLSLMGLPVVQAPMEGEAQAAHMCAQGDVWAVSSQDFDGLLFGAPRLLRNINITGRRKVPGKNIYRSVKVEKLELDRVLESLGLDRRGLVEMCLLIGTDFNAGVAGIGPKRGLSLIRKHGSLEAALEHLGMEMPGHEKVLEIFLSGVGSDDYDLSVGEPDRDGIMEFLCERHDFSPERVSSTVDKLTRGKEELEKSNRQKSLDMFF